MHIALNIDALERRSSVDFVENYSFQKQKMLSANYNNINEKHAEKTCQLNILKTNVCSVTAQCYCPMK